MRKKESILEKEIIIEAIKDISLLGGISLNFTGGEISLFPEAIAEYARIARNYGFKKISVSTSRFNLSSKVVTLWKNAGVNSLNISFDAYDEELVDAVYGMTGAWKRAFSAIKNYSKYFNTWITFTFYNQNFDEIKKVAKFCKKYV